MSETYSNTNNETPIAIEEQKKSRRQRVLERISTSAKTVKNKVRTWWMGFYNHDEEIVPIGNSAESDTTEILSEAHIAETLITEFVPEIEASQLPVAEFGIDFAQTPELIKMKSIIMNDIATMLHEVTLSATGEGTKRELFNRLQQTIFGHLARQGARDGKNSIEETTRYLEISENIAIAVANMSEHFGIEKSYADIRSFVYDKIRLASREVHPRLVLDAVPDFDLFPVTNNDTSMVTAPNEGILETIPTIEIVDPSRAIASKPQEIFVDDTRESVLDISRRQEKMKFLINYEDVVKSCSHENVAKIRNIGELRQLHSSAVVLVNELLRASRGEVLQNILEPAEALRLLGQSELLQDVAEINERIIFLTSELHGDVGNGVATQEAPEEIPVEEALPVEVNTDAVEVESMQRELPEVVSVVEETPEVFDDVGRSAQERVPAGTDVEIAEELLEAPSIVEPEAYREVITEPVADLEIPPPEAIEVSEVDQVQDVERKDGFHLEEGNDEGALVHEDTVSSPLEADESVERKQKQILFDIVGSIQSSLSQLRSAATEVDSESLYQNTTQLMSSLSETGESISSRSIGEVMTTLSNSIMRFSNLVEEENIARQLRFSSEADLSEKCEVLYRGFTALVGALDIRFGGLQSDSTEESLQILKSSFTRLTESLEQQQSWARNLIQ